ncbi:adenylate/guanylate cyclase domain-containing protein [Hyunsoonleella sp. SJ7]|uniref:Adenylate/guanylate cyclase domain-containing protein n=1 Tax=Hyunsoonleella aquatilis TaxID=2762758 RepID=A0A923HDD8_9FLAO|nr:adenylate/guanylate cyclase domain-containing protein [Hyunsoonleella aquatilis]MBC3757380.1 adenylate/guanylate cyclase domain-containing protein [Hyunsoonleella aquatilis]
MLYYILIPTALIAVFISIILRQRKKNKKLEKLLDHTNQKLERLQVHFGRFTPEEVIEHLSDSNDVFKPTNRPVTVLFADLKGFTKMCEEMDPTVVVTVLNGYFRCMSKVLTKHHGQVTELIGDGILSLFGALKNNPWQSQDAVKAALEMREALKEYNKELRAKSFPELSFGIGIHKGKVLAGVMGNYELSKFGVVGDPINVAARVEALTREFQSDILITEDIKKELDERFILKKMKPAMVKGKSKPIITYTVEELIKK